MSRTGSHCTGAQGDQDSCSQEAERTLPPWEVQRLGGLCHQGRAQVWGWPQTQWFLPSSPGLYLFTVTLPLEARLALVTLIRSFLLKHLLPTSWLECSLETFQMVLSLSSLSPFSPGIIPIILRLSTTRRHTCPLASSNPHWGFITTHAHQVFLLSSLRLLMMEIPCTPLSLRPTPTLLARCSHTDGTGRCLSNDN